MWRVMVFNDEGTACRARYFPEYKNALSYYEFFSDHPTQYAIEPVLADAFEIIQEIGN